MNYNGSRGHYILSLLEKSIDLPKTPDNNKSDGSCCPSPTDENKENNNSQEIEINNLTSPTIEYEKNLGVISLAEYRSDNVLSSFKIVHSSEADNSQSAAIKNIELHLEEEVGQALNALYNLDLPAEKYETELNKVDKENETLEVTTVEEEEFHNSSCESSHSEWELSGGEGHDQITDDEEIGMQENDSTEQTQGKRQRKRKAQKDTWCNVKNKKKRETGEEYMGMRKDDDGHWKFDIPRSGRKLKPFCNCKQSSKDTKIKCRIFTEQDRQKIFDKFWKHMTWSERKIYVNSLLDISAPKDTKNQKNLVSRRSFTNYCYLKKNGIRVRVCKKMFLNTLNIGEWQLNNWTSPKKESICAATETKENNRSFRFEERRTHLHLFFDSLPKMESHYCRASSSKMYLEPIWQSKASLFQEYNLNYCKGENVQPLSIKSFHEEFDKKNLSLFRPKKDQCDLCIGHQVNNISEDQYRKHIDRKNIARREKETDKEESHNIYTMDLQSTLLAPMLKASRIYYKKKLTVHNFTLYNLKNHDGFCYLWHEGEGGVTSHEFATIIYKFLRSRPNVHPGEEIILWSDGCSYQNRNVNLANAMLHLAAEMNIFITQKYLVSGHTQMECDSMHSTIERYLKNKEIYSPAGYVKAAKLARRNPKPYEVEYLNHTYFLDFSKLNFYKNIRPGFKTGDPVVTNICALQYRPNHELFHKLNLSDDWEVMPKKQGNQYYLMKSFPCTNQTEL